MTSAASPFTQAYHKPADRRLHPPRPEHHSHTDEAAATNKTSPSISRNHLTRLHRRPAKHAYVLRYNKTKKLSQPRKRLYLILLSLPLSCAPTQTYLHSCTKKCCMCYGHKSSSASHPHTWQRDKPRSERSGAKDSKYLFVNM